ncbi:MAG: aminotransferase class IV, partial [Planctomycetota bacterium]|nr:aminotransferase class IV [Planctomycetota bacterium]
ASVSIGDLGFIHGATVTEQIRTFAGQPFLLNEHLSRFKKGLELLEIQLEAWDQLPDILSETCQRYLISTGNAECGIGIFATPGTTDRFGNDSQGPTLCIYCYEIPWAQFQPGYETGVDLSLSQVRDTDKQCWPKNVKVRNRLHYYLADLESKKKQTIALLTDGLGNFRDTSTAAPFYVFNSKEITVSPGEEILDSVSLQFVLELCHELGFSLVRREINRSDLGQLKSMALTSTLFCLYDVNSIEGFKLHSSSDEFRAIENLWNTKTGTKIRSNCPGD